MSMSPQQIEAGALELPPTERARLARRLIESLDDEVEDPVRRVRPPQPQRRLPSAASTPAAPRASTAR